MINEELNITSICSTDENILKSLQDLLASINNLNDEADLDLIKKIKAIKTNMKENQMINFVKLKQDEKRISGFNVKIKMKQCLLLFASDDYIKNEDLDLSNCEIEKIRMFRDLMKTNELNLLDLNKINQPDTDFVSCYDWLDVKRYFKTSYEQPKTRLDFQKIFIGFIKHLTSRELIDSKKICKHYKKRTVYTYNEQHFKSLCDDLTPNDFSYIDPIYFDLLNIRR